MPSSLGWIDHDTEARERTFRLLALSMQPESRDELGIGTIRDSIADMLFPGTSTIQTRLRYMLFVPWICQKLEAQHTPANDFARRADEAEHALIRALNENGQEGVIGARAEDKLKRLPSSIYWSGLGAWGIRYRHGPITDCSLDDYQRGVDVLYRMRADARVQAADRQRRGDDPEPGSGGGLVTWHPDMPQPPRDFPQKADFGLTSAEASFVQERIASSCSGTLLASLAQRGENASCEKPWEHPAYADFEPRHKELLEHARLFSCVMHGAMLCYNFHLSCLVGNEEWISRHKGAFADWRSKLEQTHADVRSWNLDSFWQLLKDGGHEIKSSTQKFAEAWTDLVRNRPGQLLEHDGKAHVLIRERTGKVKGRRSRFTNAIVRRQWGGASGTTPLNYRWGTVRTLLNDLAEGLARKGESC